MTEIGTNSLRSKTDLSFSSTTDSTDDVLLTQTSKAGNIKVVCRFRPINDRERSMNLGLCVEFPPDPKQVHINSTSEPGNSPLKFAFDYVFPPGTDQALVYEAAAKPVVESVLEGFNGTVFAYGQTGSGKTFTMTGCVDDERLKGIIPRMITTVFTDIAAASEHVEFSVKVGYCEIYLEKIKDLLNPAKNNLKVHEDKVRGVFIADLTEEYVSDEQEVYNLMKIGQSNREVGFTLMNEGSSRSHSLFILTITQNNTSDFSAKSGKLYLVDLAGSEKVGKTGAEGKRLDEAKNINKSLSALGQVINALTDGKSSHVPYRDSKLTRVLQDSLGGNSKTALIITASPSAYNEPETISTLRFGIRAKAIKNKPTVNKEYTVAEMKVLLAKAEAEIGKKTGRIQVLESMLVEAGVKFTEDMLVTDTMETAETVVSNKSAILSPLDVDDMQGEVEELRLQNTEQNEEISLLNTKLTETQTRVSNLVSQRDKMQVEFSRLLDTIRQLEDEKNAFEAENNHFKSLCNDQKSTISSLLSANKDLEVTVIQLTQAMQPSTPGTDELQSRLEQWQNLLTEIAFSSNEHYILEIVRKNGHFQAREIAEIKQKLMESEINTEKWEKRGKELENLMEEMENSAEFRIKSALEAAKCEFDAKFEEILRENRILQEENSKLRQEIDFSNINYKNLQSAKEEEERNFRRKLANLEKSVEFAILKPPRAGQRTAVKLPVGETTVSTRDDVQTTLSTESAEDFTPTAMDSLLESERTSRFLHNRSSKIKKTIKGGHKMRVMGMLSPFASFGKPSKEEKVTEGEEGKERNYEKTLFRDT